MKECVIVSHLGLGDLILISGLAVHLAERYDVVRFPCRTQDQNSVRSFFFLQEKIKIYSFNADSTTPKNFPVYHATNNPDFVCLGFYADADKPMDKGISFAENFYKQAGVDYSVRWDKCPIQEVVDKFYAGIWGQYPFEYDFVHDDFARNFRIPNRDNEIRVMPGHSSILSYYRILMEASSIHVIDGPFLHLIESIDINDDSLYYHKYARPLSARWNDIDCPTRKKWKILQ